ncbi:negative cofactor 2 transcription regulator complex subunit [Starmerella bacillaris]|uniref:Negative cofactor 2 transcription regulator complex subunit n=1 Tax=Starmerella bacillaris TaxID=1247836 RepID=A0AAV5RK62_STABA|nr:negative cofactor 2 transcription regulator complex subunit [Starmerella bacillaris]
MSDTEKSTDENKSPLERNIKTQFPVARIKRLMQSDEDVGKVAQATPVVVAKALELFMIQLVDATCEKAKQKNAKRVSLSHLYNAVWEEEKFDFLRDVMQNYEEQLNAEPKRGRGPKKSQEKDAAKTAAPAAEVKDEE